MTRPRRRFGHRGRTRRPLVFILPIAVLSLVAVCFSAVPREMLATVSRGLNLTQPARDQPGSGAPARTAPAPTAPATSTPAPPPPAAAGAPTAVCGNAGVLSGPASAPAGAVTVPAGNNASVSGDDPGSSGYEQNDFAFVGNGTGITGVTIEYLTIENFSPPGSQGAVNTNS